MFNNEDYRRGYSDSIKSTIDNIQNRIEHENSYEDMWIDKVEYRAYIRALTDTVEYLRHLLTRVN
jgi:hypothetical protein